MAEAKGATLVPSISRIEYESPVPGVPPEAYYRREQLYPWSADGIPTKHLGVPKIHHRVPQGILSDLEVVGRNTPVRNQNGIVAESYPACLQETDATLRVPIERRPNRPVRRIKFSRHHRRTHHQRWSKHHSPAIVIRL